MDRLTERLPNGVVRTKVYGDSIILRLAAYEDSGLTPEQVAELTEKYGNDCRKIGADYYCDDKNYWLMPEVRDGKSTPSRPD